MIKILLKHLIYEKCIDIFFDTVERNFSKGGKSHNDRIVYQIIKAYKRTTQGLMIVPPPLAEMEFSPLFNYKKTFTSLQNNV